MLLTQMLSDGTKFAPLYKPANNSDHLPMTLCAMQGLGATQEVLLAFKEEYEQRLHVWQFDKAIDDWRHGLGVPSSYPALLQFFQLRLAEQDNENVIGEVLSRCLRSIALDAFHPIIRLGYAIDFGSEDEIAAGLAYIVSVHRDMPLDSAAIELMQTVINQSEAAPLTLTANRFGPSIFELVERDLYPTGSATSFATLARVALRLYQSTRNFFALHLVTATQALRCAVTEKTESEGIAAMTSAILASHLVLGSPALTDDPLPAPANLDPEHAYKFVWACLAEYREYGDDEYLDEIESFRQAGLVPSWAAAELFL